MWKVPCLRPHPRTPPSSGGTWPGDRSTAPPPPPWRTALPPGEESTPVPLSRPFLCALFPSTNLWFLFHIRLFRKRRGFVPVEPSSSITSWDTCANPGTDVDPSSSPRVRSAHEDSLVCRALYRDRCPSPCGHSGFTVLSALPAPPVLLATTDLLRPQSSAFSKTSCSCHLRLDLSVIASEVPSGLFTA